MPTRKNTIVPPLKYHGGKSNLARRIVELMPPRCENPNDPDQNHKGWLNYVEPYFGGGQVLFANDPDGISEVINDLDGELTNFWRVLQRSGDFERFRRLCEATPFSEAEYQKASKQLHDRDDDPVLAAWIFFVRCRQSLAGRMNSFAPVSRGRTRRGMNEQVSAWLGVVDGLSVVHERMRRVLVLGPGPALEVIRGQDGPRTLFYVDAPYVASTRASPEVYTYEMSDDDHRELVSTLLKIEGRAMVSMYHHPIYDELSVKHGWSLVEFDLPNNSAGGKVKRRMVECLWRNW